MLWENSLSRIIYFPDFASQGVVLIERAMHSSGKHNTNVSELRGCFSGKNCLGKYWSPKSKQESETCHLGKTMLNSVPSYVI